MQKELLGDKGDNSGLAAPGARPLRKLECSNCSIFKKPRGIGALPGCVKHLRLLGAAFPSPCGSTGAGCRRSPSPAGGLVIEPWLVPALAQLLLSPARPCKTQLISFPSLHLGCSGAGSHPAPSLRVPGWCWGPAPMAGSSHSKAEAAELKRAQAIKSTRSRWSAQSVSPPPPPPRSSLSSSFLPTPLNLVFADLSPPMTPQPFPKQDPRLPLHPQPLIPPQTKVHSASPKLHLLSWGV